MKKISQTCSAFLFLLICASLTYWGLYFMAPTSQKLSLLSENDNYEVSLAEAKSLFGGGANNEGRLPLILRGVILSGKSSESMAILGVAGSLPRLIRRDTEFMPGLVLQEIHTKHVVVLDHGWRREIPLTTFISSSSQVEGVSNANNINVVAPENTESKKP